MVRNEADMTEHPDDILRALADPERLRIAGTLAADDTEAAALAESLGLPLTRVRRHLTRLATAGVARLQPDGRTYRLDTETLRWAAQQVGPPRDAGIALGAANEDEEAVLRTFFRDGRLTEIPTKASKRRIVLERIAIEFDPGVRYDEREVNAIVGAFLQRPRRAPSVLVDEGVPRSRHRRVLARGRPCRCVDAPRAAE
jgi:DNA-binding transcriptional ArsR family regulator